MDRGYPKAYQEPRSLWVLCPGWVGLWKVPHGQWGGLHGPLQSQPFRDAGRGREGRAGVPGAGAGAGREEFPRHSCVQSADPSAAGSRSFPTQWVGSQELDWAISVSSCPEGDLELTLIPTQALPEGRSWKLPRRGCGARRGGCRLPLKIQG